MEPTPPLHPRHHTTTPPPYQAYISIISPSFPHPFCIGLPPRLPNQRAMRTASHGTQDAKAHVVAVVRQPSRLSRGRCRRRDATQSNPRPHPQQQQRRFSLGGLEAGIVNQNLHLALPSVKDKTGIPFSRGPADRAKQSLRWAAGRPDGWPGSKSHILCLLPDKLPRRLLLHRDAPTHTAVRPLDCLPGG